ncbi:MAG: DUF4139 domain-containing protein, partial [Planctomycetota bacterium]
MRNSWSPAPAWVSIRKGTRTVSDGTFLGMTEMDFVAEGEGFALFVGVADHIKLTRKLDRKRSSIVRRRRTRMEVSFVVSVENLSDQPTSLTLADRIPVSENRDIK